MGSYRCPAPRSPSSQDRMTTCKLPYKSGSTRLYCNNKIALRICFFTATAFVISSRWLALGRLTYSPTFQSVHKERSGHRGKSLGMYLVLAHQLEFTFVTTCLPYISMLLTNQPAATDYVSGFIRVLAQFLALTLPCNLIASRAFPFLRRYRFRSSSGKKYLITATYLQALFHLFFRKVVALICGICIIVTIDNAALTEDI